MTGTNERGTGIIYGVYYTLLVLMLAASFYPQYRVWGFSQWAYYPVYVTIAIFCLGAVLPFVGKRLWPDPVDEPGKAGADGRSFWIVAVIIMAGYAAAFYLLRASTHYLGDGYQLLANLSSVNPWIKLRNLGEWLIHKAVYAVLSGEESSRSLKSFQIVSYASGLVFLLSTAYAAKTLFDALPRRLLFFLGLTSGGYMLLFFGYVENYSVFLTCVTVYAVTGLLVLNERLRRWYILIPMALAVLMHTLGLTLIPPTVYLFITGTPAGAWLSQRSLRTKIILSVIVLKLCLLAFWYLYTNVIFFRFTLVPFSDGPLTIESYTLFSYKHVLDIINLWYVLLPAFPIFLVALLFAPLKELPIRREMVFLVIMTLSAVTAVILFNPKLGMPRDWDLFSFCGVPAVMFFYYTFLKIRPTSTRYIRLAVLAIVLGLAVLIPRAIGRAVGDIEVAHVENYIRLDVKKNKNLNVILRNHYTVRGDSARAGALYARWQMDFPERALSEQGIKLRNEGRLPEAVQLFQRALAENPMHVPTYAVLASCYRQLEKYDTAYAVLEIANGMDPNNTNVLAEYAYLHRQRGDWDMAEEYFNRVLSIDPTNLYAALGLLEVLWSSGQERKHDELLVRVADLPDAPGMINARLGNKYLSERRYDEAATQFNRAVDKGVDPQLLQGVLDSLARMKN